MWIRSPEGSYGHEKNGDNKNSVEIWMILPSTRPIGRLVLLCSLASGQNVKERKGYLPPKFDQVGLNELEVLGEGLCVDI